MIPFDLKAIKARAEAATPGPWVSELEDDSDGSPFGHRWTYIRGVSQPGPDGQVIFRYDDDYGTDQRSDSEFIAHARTDVPALVAAVERLRAELDRAHLARIEAQNPGIDIEARTKARFRVDL